MSEFEHTSQFTRHNMSLSHFPGYGRAIVHPSAVMSKDFFFKSTVVTANGLT